MIIKEKSIVGGQTIFLIESDWVGGSILNGQDWEPHITKFFERNLTNRSTFVDVGSNYGWHTITLSPICKEIYSFEPQKIVHDLQRLSIEKNGLTNIRLHNCGVGEQKKKIQMNPINYNDSVNIGDLSIGENGETISVETLDEMIPNGFDFVKIDVQGYEKFVLEGSIESIKKYKPTIVIEVEDHQLRKFGYGCEDLFKLIRSMGYVIYFLDYHYPSDHVCVHKDKIDEFIIKNKEWIEPLTTSNNLNRNIENGIIEKIIY